MSGKREKKREKEKKKKSSTYAFVRRRVIPSHTQIGFFLSLLVRWV